MGFSAFLTKKGVFMKSLIFFLCVFYSLLLNAQTVSSAEDSHFVSQHKQAEQDGKGDAAKVTPAAGADVDAEVDATYKSPAEEATERNASEDSSTTTNKTDRAGSRFGLSMDTIDTSVELGLEYPLSFGAHGKFHLNESIYTRFGFGFTSQVFVGAFTRFAPGLGYLNGQEAELIGDTIQNSLFGSLRFGWLPYTKKVGGPYMELGLLGFAFGRGETSGQVLNDAIGIDLNIGGKNRYSVKSDILSGTFHIGYQVPIEKHIHLNLELGILKILYVQVKQNKKNKVAFLPEKHHEEFKQFLTEKGWIFPTLSAWIGFSF